MKILFFTLLLSATVIQTVPAMEDSSESKGYGYGYVTLPELSKELAKDSGEKEYSNEGALGPSQPQLKATNVQITTNFKALKNEAYTYLHGDYRKNKLRLKIIASLHYFLQENKLKMKDQQDALEIAEALKEGALAEAIRNYNPPQVLTEKPNKIVKLPAALMEQLITHLSERRDGRVLLEFLAENQGFDMNLLKGPVALDLSPYREKITDDILERLIALFPSMRALNLGTCRKITGAGFKHLQNLTNLTHLNLRFTSFTDDDLKVLKDIHTLTNLNLEYTKITDVGLNNTVRYLDNLTTLNLSGIDFIDKRNLLACINKLPKLLYLRVGYGALSIFDLRGYQLDRPSLRIN